MTVLLLASLALAAPTPPEPHEPVPNECPAIVAIRPGQPLPVEVDHDGDGIPDCGGSLLPASEHLDLLAWRSYAVELETRHALLLERVAVLERPPRLFDRPHVARAVGRLEALATVAVAVALVDQARR